MAKPTNQEVLGVNTETSKPVVVHNSENMSDKLVPVELLQRIDVALFNAGTVAEVEGLVVDLKEIESLREALREVLE